MSKKYVSTSEFMRVVRQGIIPEVEGSLAVEPQILNTLDAKSRTPLHIACKYGQIEVARVLIRHGANLNPKNCWGHTPLHTLCNLGIVDHCKVLIEAGASLSIVDNAGYTPLEFALHHNNVAVASLLIRSGSPVNTRGPRAGIGSPLHWACKHGDEALITLLVEAGADVSVKNFWRRTPGDVCCSQRIREVLMESVELSCSGDSFANIYAPAGGAAGSGRIVRKPEDEDICVSYQEQMRQPTQHAAASSASDEITKFLLSVCTPPLDQTRAKEVVAKAAMLDMHTLRELAHELDTDEAFGTEYLRLTGVEQAAVMSSLAEKGMLDGYVARGVRVRRVRPLEVGERVLEGIFVGSVVQPGEDESNAKEICLKTDNGCLREIAAELRILKECIGLSGVVELCGCGTAQETRYIALDMFGEDLAQLLSRSMSTEERAAAFVETCIAVCSLHSYGVVHGDLAPEHILVKSRGGSVAVKVCGLSSARRSGEEFPCNRDGQLKYTHGYAAPEVYFGSPGRCRASPKIDIFSLGLIGIFLIGKRSLHDQNTPDSELKKVLRDQKQLNLAISRALGYVSSRDMILRMCKLDPTERGDIETVVNIMQTRMTEVENDSTLFDACSAYDEICSKFESDGYVLSCKLALNTRCYGLIKNAKREFDRALAAASSCTDDDLPVDDIKACNRLIENVLSTCNDCSDTGEFSVLTTRFSSVNQLASDSLMQYVYSTVLDKLVRFQDALMSVVDSVEAVVEARVKLGRCTEEAVSSSSSLVEYIRLIKLYSLRMSEKQMEHAEEIKASVARLELSMQACSGINPGLVHFMQSELSNLYSSLHETLGPARPAPCLTFFLPSATLEPSDDGSLRIRASQTHYRPYFMCCQSYELRSGGLDIYIPSQLLVQSFPISKLCLVALKKVVASWVGALDHWGFPQSMNTSELVVKYIDYALKVLEDCVNGKTESDGSKEDIVSIDDIQSYSDDVLLSSLHLDQQIISSAYSAICNIVETNHIDVSRLAGFRQVTSCGRVGWIVDRNDVELRFME